jgi:hypothetical protein
VAWTSLAAPDPYRLTSIGPTLRRLPELRILISRLRHLNEQAAEDETQ